MDEKARLSPHIHDVRQELAGAVTAGNTNKALKSLTELLALTWADTSEISFTPEGKSFQQAQQVLNETFRWVPDTTVRRARRVDRLSPVTLVLAPQLPPNEDGSVSFSLFRLEKNRLPDENSLLEPLTIVGRMGPLGDPESCMGVVATITNNPQPEITVAYHHNRDLNVPCLITGRPENNNERF